jgi:hypothetical protein
MQISFVLRRCSKREAKRISNSNTADNTALICEIVLIRRLRTVDDLKNDPARRALRTLTPSALRDLTTLGNSTQSVAVHDAG